MNEIQRIRQLAGLSPILNEEYDREKDLFTRYQQGKMTKAEYDAAVEAHRYGGSGMTNEDAAEDWVDRKYVVDQEAKKESLSGKIQFVNENPDTGEFYIADKYSEEDTVSIWHNGKSFSSRDEWVNHYDREAALNRDTGVNEDREITDDEVAAAYRARHEAFVNNSPDKHRLADRASMLANMYAQQEAMKAGTGGFDPITGRTINLGENVSSDSVSELAAKLASGELTYAEFRDELDSLEQTDYSMRQGEMGNPDFRDDQNWEKERSEWELDDDFNTDEYDIDENTDESEDDLTDDEIDNAEGSDEFGDLNDFASDYSPNPNLHEDDEVPDEEIDEDLNNGYTDVDYADGDDYFPNGADGSVVRATGPSGARQGDNPEQKKMQVAETHKELVQRYRKFLKESNK